MIKFQLRIDSALNGWITSEREPNAHGGYGAYKAPEVWLDANFTEVVAGVIKRRCEFPKEAVITVQIDSEPNDDLPF